MPDNLDADRERVCAYLGTPEGEALVRALARSLDAREQDRGANSDDARENAELACLVADTALAEATGSADIRRRRILRELDDLPPGTKVDTASYGKRIAAAVRDASRAGRARIRFVLARMTLDFSGSVGGPLTNHLAGALMQVAKGRYSILDVDQRQGGDPDTGAALMLHTGVVAAAGYQAGAFYGVSRIPDVLWAEASEVHNAAARQLRRDGEACDDASSSTIRDWCVRKRSKKGTENEDRKSFDSARRQGIRAARLGLVDPTNLLAALRK